MQEISETTFLNWLDQAFREDKIKKNNLYHAIVDCIKQNSPEDSVSIIIDTLQSELDSIKSTLQEKTIDGESAKALGLKKGVVRRVG